MTNEERYAEDMVHAADRIFHDNSIDTQTKIELLETIIEDLEHYIIELDAQLEEEE